MNANDYQRSYVSKLIQRFKSEERSGTLNRSDEEAIIWTAASLYGAAADTTVITLSTFTLAMMLFPHVQLKAQEEIDRVVGTDRLPNFDDRNRLPYINALVKEALRWWPIAPMGFPHVAESDVEYNGLHIPKGAYLLPAVWWFLHDPEVYADPDSFNPERFLSPRNEPDPDTEGFGYGRRICPGRFFADSGLYINIVQTLATFDIGKSIGGDGMSTNIDVSPKPGILSYPSEFHFQVTPRSQKHVDVIRRFESEHPLESGDSGLLQSETN
jgi:cytochrome P450